MEFKVFEESWSSSWKDKKLGGDEDEPQRREGEREAPACCSSWPKSIGLWRSLRPLAQDPYQFGSISGRRAFDTSWTRDEGVHMKHFACFIPFEQRLILLVCSLV